MKYITLCVAGLSDRPAPDLDGLTPLQAADTPALDRLASRGKVSRCRTIAHGTSIDGPDPLYAILGFDGRQLPMTDPGPTEALASHLDLPAGSQVMRCDLLSLAQARGTVRDHTQAGLVVAADEYVALMSSLADALGREAPEIAESNRFMCRGFEPPLLVDTSPADVTGIELAAPAALIGRSLARHIPSRRGTLATWIDIIVKTSKQVFDGHEVNQARESVGLLPITHVWPWGAGLMPQIQRAGESFAERHRVPGCMISCTSLALGVAERLGMQTVAVEPEINSPDHAGGASPLSLLETVTGEMGSLAEAVCAGDNQAPGLTVVYVSGIDRLSLAGDVQQKIKAIEYLDACLVRRVMEEALGQARGHDWRLSLIPAFSCDSSNRARLLDPVPTLIAGKDVHSLVSRKFNEQDAAESDLLVESGHDWMEYFLYGGLMRK